MELKEQQLEQIGAYVKTHLNEWISETGVVALYGKELLERSIRAEEGIKNLSEQIDMRTNLFEKRFQESQEYMNKRFEQVDKRFEQVDKRFEQVDKRFEESREYMDKRFEQIDKRFEQIDKRFEQVDKRFEENRIDMDRRFEESRADMNKRFNQIDKKFNRMSTFLFLGFTFITVFMSILKIFG